MRTLDVTNLSEKEETIRKLLRLGFQPGPDILGLQKRLQKRLDNHLNVVIVGADERKWLHPQRAKNAIRKILGEYAWKDIVLGSGECPLGGVDIWTREINAADFHFPFKPFPPEAYGWTWFKKRNIEMAEWCDVLYCISVSGIWDGGQWTANYARDHGKTVKVVHL